MQLLAYANAGHLVFGPPIPTDCPFYPRLAMLGGTVEGNAIACADNWPRIIAFLRQSTATTPLTTE